VITVDYFKDDPWLDVTAVSKAKVSGVVTAGLEIGDSTHGQRPFKSARFLGGSSANHAF
jgi:hypothetical protein